MTWCLRALASVIAAAKLAAEDHGWPFGWTLIEVPDVGHNATKMFGAIETLAAFDDLAPRRSSMMALLCSQLMPSACL